MKQAEDNIVVRSSAIPLRTRVRRKPVAHAGNSYCFAQSAEMPAYRATVRLRVKGTPRCAGQRTRLTAVEAQFMPWGDAGPELANHGEAGASTGSLELELHRMYDYQIHHRAKPRGWLPTLALTHTRSVSATAEPPTSAALSPPRPPPCFATTMTTTQ